MRKKSTLLLFIFILSAVLNRPVHAEETQKGYYWFLSNKGNKATQSHSTLDSESKDEKNKDEKTEDKTSDPSAASEAASKTTSAEKNSDTSSLKTKKSLSDLESEPADSIL